MSEPLLLLAIFLSILCALIFTRWPPVWVFVVGLLANYFLGYVESSEIFVALVKAILVRLEEVQLDPEYRQRPSEMSRAPYLLIMFCVLVF